MAKFFGILGMCFCFYAVAELLGRISRSYEGSNPASPLLTPLTLLSVICLFLSLPVGIFILWHDNRMRDIHNEEFRKERRPYDEMMQNREQSLEKEIKELKEQIWDERFAHNEELENQGRRYGYRTGFTNGFNFCFKSASLSRKDYPEMFRAALDQIDKSIDEIELHTTVF